MQKLALENQQKNRGIIPPTGTILSQKSLAKEDKNIQALTGIIQARVWARRTRLHLKSHKKHNFYKAYIEKHGQVIEEKFAHDI